MSGSRGKGPRALAGVALLAALLGPAPAFACMLPVAVLDGDLEGVRGAIAAGMDLENLDGNGATPLHVAATRGDARVVEALLEAGADPGARTPQDKTPLDLARLYGHEAVVALLEEARASATKP